MNGRQAKKLRRLARRMANEEMVPSFKAMVNTEFSLGERLSLAWRILVKRF